MVAISRFHIVLQNWWLCWKEDNGTQNHKVRGCDLTVNPMRDENGGVEHDFSEDLLPIEKFSGAFLIWVKRSERERWLWSETFSAELKFLNDWRLLLGFG